MKRVKKRTKMKLKKLMKTKEKMIRESLENPGYTEIHTGLLFSKINGKWYHIIDKEIYENTEHFYKGVKLSHPLKNHPRINWDLFTVYIEMEDM